MHTEPGGLETAEVVAVVVVGIKEDLVVVVGEGDGEGIFVELGMVR